MQKYLKDYMKRHGYGMDDVLLCEECGAKAVDLHHKVFRSHEFSDKRDSDDNLVLLCRECHNKYHQ